MKRLLALIIAWVAFSGMPLAAGDLPGLYIRPGERVTFDLEDGQPASPQSQVGDGEIFAEMRVVEGNTLLMIRNDGAKPLNYKAFVSSDRSEAGEPTSVCTLLPGKPVFESWQGELPGLRLADFEAAPDDNVTCR